MLLFFSYVLTTCVEVRFRVNIRSVKRFVIRALDKTLTLYNVCSSVGVRQSLSDSFICVRPV